MTLVAAPKLPTEELQRLLDEARLPTMPQATLRIMELAGDPFTSLDHVATVVATDPALSARVLGLSNSVLYNRGRPFECIGRAVAHLGVMRIRSLALAMHLFAFQPDRRHKSFDYAYYWRYCLTCAVAAKLIAAQQGPIDPEEGFVAGLLQDIGVLVLHRAHPLEYAKVLNAKGRGNARLYERESELWGYDHADVGAALAAHWGLPLPLGNAIRLHHRPGSNPTANVCRLADLVHATIYETSGSASVNLAGKLRAETGDETALLRGMEMELPHIAEACSCPSWSGSTEAELKEHISLLLDETL